MRAAFAHDAVLGVDEDGDIRAPGAAITLALCGHWDHEPPCPLAPHHTAADRGSLTGPDGVTTHWRFSDAAPSAVRDDEAGHAAGPVPDSSTLHQ